MKNETYDERKERLLRIAQQMVQVSVEQQLTVRELNEVMDLVKGIATETPVFLNRIDLLENLNNPDY